MKIIFSGGGTLGPVTPLLAIHEVVKTEFPKVQSLWIGTTSGPEKALIEEQQIPFYTIASAKLRRYISLSTFVDIFKFFVAFFQSFFFLLKHKPYLCIGAGGYTCIPVHLAAWVLRIPTWIHQQDVEVSLTNKILAPFSTVITVALEESVHSFPQAKTLWIGNPVREEILSGSKAQARKIFGLMEDLPVLLVLGGGTGAQKINELLMEVLPSFDGVCQVIHLTGKERSVSLPDPLPNFYHVYPFLTTDMKHAYAVADLLIARAGFGTLSEAAALSKPVLVIPKFGHQEKNAEYFSRHDAVVVCNENTLTAETLLVQIKQSLENKPQRDHMAEKFSQVLPRAKKEALISILQKFLSRH